MSTITKKRHDFSNGGYYLSDDDFAEDIKIPPEYVPPEYGQCVQETAAEKPVLTGEKRCTVCLMPKPKSFFRRARPRRDGTGWVLIPACKNCEAIKTKEYRRQPEERRRLADKAKERRKDNAYFEWCRRYEKSPERREQIKRRRSTERYYLMARRRKMQRAMIDNKTEWGRRKAKQNLLETEAQLRANGWIGRKAWGQKQEK